MIRLCLAAFAVFLALIASAQRQFPPFSLNIDSIFDICLAKTTTGKQKLQLLSQVDAQLQQLENDFPLFRGMVYLYEAYHAPEGEQRKRYNERGIGLMRNNPANLADSFSYQCYQLLGYYASADRLQEWIPADNLLRTHLSTQPNDNEWCIFSYANKKMLEGSYQVAINLASYDRLIAPKKFPPSTDQRLVSVYDEWIALNSRYKEWLAVPYYKRNENYTLKTDFTTLIRNIHGLRDSVLLFNTYGGKNTRVYLRQLYYRVYKDVVMAYADWSINDHREGQAISRLKDFIVNDAIPNEIVPAVKAKVTPVMTCTDVSNLYAKLADLYINTGNGALAAEATKNGIAFLDKYKYCGENEVSRGISFLFYQQVKANRAEGKYEAALKKAQLLKKWWPLPKSISADSMNLWNWFIEAKLQEVYTLIAKHSEAAVDSLSLLLQQLEPIENDTVHLLNSSYQWPQLQFASMQYMAQLGKWPVVKDYLLEALTIIEQDNHWENVPYYYDMQLLYLIATYRSDGKLLKHVLHNLLFYTGRQLQHSFFMLKPEDRIRFYEQRLGTFFDVYHELLFNKQLDTDSALKEKVIAQSLHLKNALVDANLVPNEFLVKNNDSAWLKLTEDIRKSRSRTNVLSSRIKMRSRNEDDVSDDGQKLWIQLLESADLDSFSRFGGWKKIASAVKPQQVYVEGIRYTKWLSDSASAYAAYVIRDHKLETVPLFNEASILRLLRDPSASPQSAVLSRNATRGLTLTKKDTTAGSFRAGAVDKLGALILAPLWSSISAKKELLIVPDGLLNRVSLAALEWKGHPLFAQLRIKQLSGSYVLQEPKASFPGNGKALVAGGLDYGELQDGSNINRLLNRNYSWRYLPATKKEAEDIRPIFAGNGNDVTLLTGNDFPDSLSKRLSAYNFIHLATHGFYVDSSAARLFYDRNWNSEAIQDDPMMRCGIALSGANFPDPKSLETDGYLLGFELANTDLRNCYLISLSACETGLGDLRNNLGVDGLSRALKLGGAKYLLISLWKVPDAPTAVFMQQFYKELFRLKDPAEALQSTQAFMSRQYNVSDWAAFILVQ